MKNWLSIRHTCEDQVRSFLWCEELVPILYTYKSLTHATKKTKNWHVSQVSSKFVNDFLLQSDPRSTIRPAFFFRGDLVMKIFLQPFSLFKKNIWQLMAQECSLSIGRAVNCLIGLPRNSVVRSTVSVLT